MTYQLEIVNGRPVPSADAIRALVTAVRKEIEEDSSLQDAFRDNPRQFLGDRGFTRDMQREILAESGMNAPESCTGTCISTGSCCCETM